MSIQDVRDEFVQLWLERDKVKPGGTLEIIGASFLAAEPTIFGQVNRDYVERELQWYLSTSLNVNDIPGGPPKIWETVATSEGEINSNYGFLMFSAENGSQYTHVLKSLREKPDGRQATAIYTRPTMHTDWNRDGMHDFVCTNAVCYFVRDDAVHAVVQMRSNDAIFGYRNDYAWQKSVVDGLANDLGLAAGTITWQAASLHVYPRHWRLVQEYYETGKWDGKV